MWRVQPTSARVVDSIHHKVVVSQGQGKPTTLVGLIHQCFNSVAHEFTLKKPSFLLFTVDLHSPTEAALLLPRDLLLSHQPMSMPWGFWWKPRSSTNDSVTRRPGQFLCDWALIHVPQDESGKQWKLSRPWHGPYRITAINQLDATLIKVYMHVCTPHWQCTVLLMWEVCICKWQCMNPMAEADDLYFINYWTRHIPS